MLLSPAVIKKENFKGYHFTHSRKQSCFSSLIKFSPNSIKIGNALLNISRNISISQSTQKTTTKKSINHYIASCLAEEISPNLCDAIQFNIQKFQPSNGKVTSVRINTQYYITILIILTSCVSNALVSLIAQSNAMVYTHICSNIISCNSTEKLNIIKAQLCCSIMCPKFSA